MMRLTEQASVSLRLCAAIAASALFLVAALVSCASAQSASRAGLISIHLEQKVGEASKTVPQNTVFRSGDILRFRLTSGIAGYLYIVAHGTSGQTTTLFPATTATSMQNRIEVDQTVIVPAIGEGWFEVSGPSGFDTVYLLVSSSPIVIPPTALPQTEEPQEKSLPANLLPRCNDEIFKARGECVDSSAGAAPLPPDAPVPRELIPFAKSASRDIILTDDGNEVTVKPTPSAKLPLIYTFRLAHLQ